jgi:tetratricopeptide (TPR) repeat protein
MQRRWDSRLWVLSSAVFFLALIALFVLTHAASLYLDDSGETVTVAALLGIGHPPGYPLYSLLSHAWISLPLAGLPGRVNLLAAVLAALSATLLFAWLSHRQAKRTWPAAACIAALYATGPVFWHNALGAKGGVYQLNNLFSVALFALLAWQRSLSLARLRAFWLLLGLSLAHHYMSQTPLLPAYAWLLWALPGQPSRSQRWRDAWLLLPGASLYAYLFLRSAQEPGLNWGAIHSWSDFGFFFFRLQYATGELTRSASGSWRQGIHALGLLWREGAFVLLPLALASLWALRKEALAQALGLACLASWAAVALYLNLSVDRLDLMKPYLFPAYLAQAGLAGLGLAACLQRSGLSVAARRGLQALCCALPLLSLAQGYRSEDLSAYFYAQDNAANILRALPQNALIFAQGDAVIFPLWYEQRVAGLRTDVAVVGNAVLPMDWVRDDLKRRYPDVLQPRITGPIGAESVGRLVEVLVEMNAGRRPLYAAYNKLDPPIPGWHLVSEGQVYRLAPDTEKAPQDLAAVPAARLQASVIRGYTHQPLDARTHLLVVGDFAIHNNGVGVSLEEAGQYEAAALWYRRAMRIDPTSPEYPFNLGNAMNELKRPAEAADAYALATQVDPGYSSAWYNLAVTEYQGGQREAAVKAFKQVLSLDPQRQDIRQLLQQLGAPAS